MEDARERGVASRGTGLTQRLTRLMDGYLSTQLLYLAARLGLADVLGERPLPSGELARRVGAGAGTLRRIPAGAPRWTT
jgi:hypothetical protein